MADFDPLPEGWEVVKLGEIASLVSGGTPSKTRPEFWQGNIPWVSPKDMKRPQLYDAEDHISEAGLADGSRLVPAGTLFIVVRGMILSKDLPVAIAMVPMAFNQDMKAIRPNGRVDAEYLLYALVAHKSRMVPEVGTSAHGTRRIGTDAINDFLLPLPSISEQQAIARTLRVVQHAKDSTGKVIDATGELKQSLMRHLFTYGPVPIPQADHVKLRETGAGLAPQHWKVCKLKGLLREPLRNGHSSRATNTEKGIRTLTLTAVTKNDFSIKHTKLTSADFNRVRAMWLRPGDIFIERANTPEYVGLAALYEGDENYAIFSDLMVRVRVDERLAEPKFIAELLLTEACRNYFRTNAKATTGNFPKIDQTIIEDTIAVLPPLEEQRQIVKALRTTDAKLKAETFRLKALDELFATLLMNLMTGRVRVGDFALA